MQVPLLLFLALAGVGDATAPEPQSSGEQNWSYEQTASVRLVIRSTPPLAAPRAVTCSVVGPGPTGVTSTVRRVFRGGEYSAYYPGDFARRPTPGDYTWTCDVVDGVHATGSFVINDDGTIAVPARSQP
jgi:hypothetical protein